MCELGLYADFAATRSDSRLFVVHSIKTVLSFQVLCGLYERVGRLFKYDCFRAFSLFMIVYTKHVFFDNPAPTNCL
jgi:hypothetical protein